MYPSYHRQGRDMILYFLNKHFGDKDKDVYKRQVYRCVTLGFGYLFTFEQVDEIFTEDS